MSKDTISRQAAIEAFMTATSDGDKAEWCKWVLEQLPSAQPERLTLRVNHELTKEEYDKLMHDIKDAPIVLLSPAQPSADVVEVVRCKDCQWWERDSQPRYHSDERPCIIVEMATSPEWFCADGERRDDD